MNGFLENVKRAALEAVNAAKPFAFVLGKVTSVSPLKVQVDQKLELTAAQLKLREQVAVSDKAKTQAELINSWLLDIDFDSASDLERNCSVFAKGEYVTAKQVGRLAYMPLAYEHYMERKVREEQRANMENTSAYVGEVGTRLTLDLTAAVLLASWYNDFGTTYLYKFVDEAGNVFIWYASRPIELQERMTLKATIKAHNERNGVKQTVLTRCKVVA